MKEHMGPNFFVTFSTNISFVRLVYGTLMPVRFSLECEVGSSEKATAAIVNETMTKIKIWLDEVVSTTVAFSFDCEEACAMFLLPNGLPSLDNTVMMTPGEPTDELLTVLIHAKLNALGNGALVFNTTTLKNTSQDGLSFCFVGDYEDVLPEQEEWISEDTFYDSPWWARNDGSMQDSIMEDEDPTTEPVWAINIMTNVESPSETVESETSEDQKAPFKVQFRPFGKGK